MSLPARLIPCLLPALSALALALPARAQALPDEGALRAFLGQQIAAAAPQLSRFDIQFLPAPSRAELAPCARAEPFLPAGVRPWGRIGLGLRCVDGAGWTVLLPVQVRAWGRAVVAAAPLAAGAVPTDADVREDEVELTREPASVLRDASALQGRQLVRAVNPGQVLRADMLRQVMAVQAGDAVKLRIQGTGFAVVAAGQALSSAAENQPVRVRTELGKVLTGVAREGRLVDVAL